MKIKSTLNDPLLLEKLGFLDFATQLSLALDKRLVSLDLDPEIHSVNLEFQTGSVYKHTPNLEDPLTITIVKNATSYEIGRKMIFVYSHEKNFVLVGNPTLIESSENLVRYIVNHITDWLK